MKLFKFKFVNQDNNEYMEDIYEISQEKAEIIFNQKFTNVKIKEISTMKNSKKSDDKDLHKIEILFPKETKA